MTWFGRQDDLTSASHMFIDFLGHDWSPAWEATAEDLSNTFGFHHSIPDHIMICYIISLWTVKQSDDFLGAHLPAHFFGVMLTGDRFSDQFPKSRPNGVQSTQPFAAAPTNDRFGETVPLV